MTGESLSKLWHAQSAMGDYIYSPHVFNALLILKPNTVNNQHIDNKETNEQCVGINKVLHNYFALPVHLMWWPGPH